MKRTVATSLIIFIIMMLGTTLTILYAKGYRIVPQKNGTTIVEGTGLLVVTSEPDGAEVHVNGELLTATNNTLNLSPGEYDVEIIQEGYFPWKKKVNVQKEIVTQAQALLLPIAPKLEAVTLTGAQNPVVDPLNGKIGYTVSSATQERNGIYVLDMNANPLLTLGSSARQIANTRRVDFSNATLQFSPEGDEVLASLSDSAEATPASSLSATYLLKTNGLNDNPQNVTATIDTILAEWAVLQAKKDQKRIDSLPRKLRPHATANFKDPIYSPELDKILYEASVSATLPIIITPRLIGANNTQEQRNIKEGSLYVYDIKEDRNYLLYESPSTESIRPNYIWHPGSNHLFYIQERKIYITSFDGTNRTNIYSGPFVPDFFAAWPNGSRLLILTNLNSIETPYNLYTLSLK
jgi:hypothetical protein